MVVGPQARCREGPIEPLAGDCGNPGHTEMTQENELAVAGRLRDPYKNLVVLRQIFVQRLCAPEHGRPVAQTQFLARNRNRLAVDRFVID